MKIPPQYLPDDCPAKKDDTLGLEIFYETDTNDTSLLDKKLTPSTENISTAHKEIPQNNTQSELDINITPNFSHIENSITPPPPKLGLNDSISKSEGKILNFVTFS